MSRIAEIRRPQDYPGTPDEATRADLAELFATLFPGQDAPEIDDAHSAIALAAHNPKMAMMMARLTAHIATTTLFGQRTDLREIAVLAVNLHFGCHFGWQVRIPNARAAGVTEEMQGAVPYWRTAQELDAEQRLVAEFAYTAASGKVPEELFARVVSAFGEKAAVELTGVVGMWAFWAILINAAG